MGNEPSRIGTFESIGSAAERVVRKVEVTPNVPRWAWHTAALANPKQIGKTLIVTTSPEEGWFRAQYKGGQWEPVVIWQDGERWFALRGIEPNRKVIEADDVWTWCCRYPISFAEYERVAEQGAEWSDVDSVVHSQRKGPPRPGSNEPGDEAEMLKDQIASAVAGASKYGKLKKWTTRGKTKVPEVESFIKSDDDLAKAQSLRARLNELSGEGDKKFHAEKDPITRDGKRVDDRWRFRDEADDTALIIRSAMEVYQNEQLRLLRVAEDARAKAEQEAAKAREEAEVSFVAPEATPMPEPALPPAPAPLPTTVKGSYGRAATTTAVTEVTEVTDIDALLAWRPVHDHADMKPFLLDLAKRAYKAGHRDIPGVKVEERMTVR
jgi:hypothetical protein